MKESRRERMAFMLWIGWDDVTREDTAEVYSSRGISGRQHSDDAPPDRRIRLCAGFEVVDRMWEAAETEDSEGVGTLDLTHAA